MCVTVMWTNARGISDMTIYGVAVRNLKLGLYTEGKWQAAKRSFPVL